MAIPEIERNLPLVVPAKSTGLPHQCAHWFAMTCSLLVPVLLFVIHPSAAFGGRNAGDGVPYERTPKMHRGGCKPCSHCREKTESIFRRDAKKERCNSFCNTPFYMAPPARLELTTLRLGEFGKISKTAIKSFYRPVITEKSVELSV